MFKKTFFEKIKKITFVEKMKEHKIALIAETKNPPDKRAAITPSTAKQIINKYPKASIFVQKSHIRAFKDEEYKAVGLEVKEDIGDSDILIGLKDVKVEKLIPFKTYLMFAHVAKKQEHNKELLKAIVEKRITLIDYEYLTDTKGNRLVAFGKWAGIVGAYNAIRMWGLKTKQFEIAPAHTFLDKAEMFAKNNCLKCEPIKIVITGGGRVATGAMETLQNFGIEQVAPEDFLYKSFSKTVFTKLDPWHYVRHRTGMEFNLEHFFENPSEYISIFEAYTKVADMYIACHFWDPNSPHFITQKMMQSSDFRIRAIADVSCDVNGPIASTIRASSIENPFYDYNPTTGKEEKAFSSQNNVSVMSVDNLPAELPRDSSEEFSNNLVDRVFPHLFEEDLEKVIERATIVKNGMITPKYSYLVDWINS